MQRGHAEAAAVMAAQPHAVYAVFADYRHAHPQILPKPPFTKLEVERGGWGAGTVMRVYTRAFGRERVLHLEASEPQPGRVLLEQALDSDLATTFTVLPIDDGRQSHVTIATDWTPRPGVAGSIERAVTERFMRRIYKKELQQLAAYLRQHNDEATGAAPEARS